MPRSFIVRSLRWFVEDRDENSPSLQYSVGIFTRRRVTRIKKYDPPSNDKRSLDDSRWNDFKTTRTRRVMAFHFLFSFFFFVCDARTRQRRFHDWSTTIRKRSLSLCPSLARKLFNHRLWITAAREEDLRRTGCHENWESSGGNGGESFLRLVDPIRNALRRS